MILGAFADARSHVLEAFRTYDNAPDTKFDWVDWRAYGTLVFAALCRQSNEPERARELIEQAKARVRSRHDVSFAITFTWTPFLEALRGDARATLSDAETLAEVSARLGLRFAAGVAKIYRGWARAQLEEREGGLEQIRLGLAELAELKALSGVPFYRGLLAEIEAEGSSADYALTQINEALALARKTGQVWTDAFLHRIRGDILLKVDPGNPPRSEEAYLAAITTARGQGARSFGLQAALKLAKLYQSTARPVDAHAVLAPALKGFAPTPEMPEIGEAQALLAALAQTDEVNDFLAQRERRLRLQTSYGQAVMWSKGYVAEETQAAFARARELAAGTESAAERFPGYYVRWVRSYLRGEHREAREIAATFLREAEQGGHATEACAARRCLGTTCLYLGDLIKSRDHLERALADYRPDRDAQARFRFGHDIGVAAAAYLSNAVWHLGEAERARRLAEQAVLRAAESGYVPDSAIALALKINLEAARGDAAAALRAAESLLALAREHGINHYRSMGECASSWARGRLDDPQVGARELRRAMAERSDHGAGAAEPGYLGWLAELEARTLAPDKALTLIDQGLASVQETGERLTESALYRLRGEILLQRNQESPAPAEEAYRTSIGVAKELGARSSVLLASLSLAKLYQSTGRPAEAHAVLAPALEGFSPTPEMPEIEEAQALLAALAETDDVKADATQRERRLRLQTAYGQAVMWSKGFAADETSAAFARSRELAGGTESAAERFPPYYVQWVRSLAQGEHRQAQRSAESFLWEAEEGGYATEAGVARRCLGASCFYQGKLLEAQTHLERALADYRPDRDAQARFRFGYDTGILATANLVTTTWLLGQVERARQLAEQAVRSATELGHVPTCAFAHAFKTGLEIIRDDPAAALRSAETLLALVREHEMEFFVAVGEAYAGWARGRLGDPEAGAQAIRRALAEYFNEANKINAPLFRGLLAELEGATWGPDAALTQIGKGLAIAEETGEHYTDPYLHRLRGEFLLKRDPPNSVPAEEAFQTAIAIAKEQGARSYELLASLSLAKLCQCLGRPAEAHAVLAPALEGFSPTPEMPEIAEAQALLAALAEIDEVKADVAQRHRRLRLQRSYGLALMWGKGFAAEEAKAAFARNRRNLRAGRRRLRALRSLQRAMLEKFHAR